MTHIGAALLAIVVLSAASNAEASTVEALSLEELTERAQTIVVGEVVWQQTVVRAGGIIQTWSRLRVEQQLRGDTVPSSEMLVETLGGQVGRLGMQVPGEPQFRMGERVVVFAHGSGERKVIPVGMAQGVIRVSLEGGVDMAVPSLEGLHLVRRDTRGGWTKSTGPLEDKEPLDLFLGRVRSIVESQARARDE